MGRPLETNDPDRIEAQWRSALPQFDYEATSLWVRMRRTTRMLVDAMAGEVAKHDLTVADFDTIAALYRQGPPRALTINALAQATTRSHGSISVHIDRLSRRGLVTRLTSQKDGRITRVRLTQKGVTLVESVIPGFVDLQRDVFAVLSREERQTFNEFLTRIWLNDPAKRESPD